VLRFLLRRRKLRWKEASMECASVLSAKDPSAERVLPSYNHLIVGYYNIKNRLLF
jgi:hypothetical protein